MCEFAVHGLPPWEGEAAFADQVQSKPFVGMHHDFGGGIRRQREDHCGCAKQSLAEKPGRSLRRVHRQLGVFGKTPEYAKLEAMIPWRRFIESGL
jgi:hypothetical protein